MRDHDTLPELTADIEIPAGSTVTVCRGCGKYIYFVTSPLNRRISTPVSTECAGGQNPTKTTPGAGTNHFRNCPQRDKFRREKSPR